MNFGAIWVLGLGFSGRQGNVTVVMGRYAKFMGEVESGRRGGWFGCFLYSWCAVR